jgi:NTE family protein
MVHCLAQNAGMASASTSSPTSRSINLALQGGGSHGAFTWGVLDTLLADTRIHIEGLSGASAGAVNAVALAHGYAVASAQNQDPREAARASLTRIWGQITAMGSLGSLQKNIASILWSGLPSEFAPTNIISQTFHGLFSPYQSNPLDINPLRSLLAREIDFEAIARPGGPKVFVSATHVNTGKAVVFSGKQLTAQAVMASACLPMLFRAVEIDGEHYWDGGYSVNPALTPLIDHCESADLVLVQINPLRREDAPQTPHEILDRVNELTFNASLLTQMRSIEFINRLLEDGWLEGSPCRSVLLHRIDGGKAMQQYPASSKVSTDGVMIHQLFELGRMAASRWLANHFDELGIRSTVNISRDYLDDTRIASFKPAAPPTPAGPGYAPAPPVAAPVAATSAPPEELPNPPSAPAGKRNIRSLLGGLFKRRKK